MVTSSGTTLSRAHRVFLPLIRADATCMSRNVSWMSGSPSVRENPQIGNTRGDSDARAGPERSRRVNDFSKKQPFLRDQRNWHLPTITGVVPIADCVQDSNDPFQPRMDMARRNAGSRHAGNGRGLDRPCDDRRIAQLPHPAAISMENVAKNITCCLQGDNPLLTEKRKSNKMNPRYAQAFTPAR